MRQEVHQVIALLHSNSSSADSELHMKLDHLLNKNLDATNEINLLQIQLEQSQMINAKLDKENRRLKKRQSQYRERSKSGLSSRLEFSLSTKSIKNKKKKGFKRSSSKKGKLQSRSLMLLPNERVSFKSTKSLRRSRKMNKSFVSNNSDIQNIFQGHDLSGDKIYGDVIAGPGENIIYKTQQVRRNSSMPPRSPSPIFGRKKT